MDSEIQKFYTNKTIFITGGSGFVGRVVIEKLLRATEIGRIYVLMRPKRDKSPQERIELWKNDSLFTVLLKSKPKSLERVSIIEGDCKDPDLGISSTDRELLKEKVEVVIHSAATVRFNEPMHVALDTNVRSTSLMLQLAKQMRRLVAFVHVSTAYSNCVTYDIKERFYPEFLNCTADKVLALRELLSNELIDQMGPALLDKFPNTYTYSKALAEQLVQIETGNIPMCIVRPGSIIATNKEPVSGWIDNLYGPIALLYGGSYAIIHAIPLNENCLLHMVPVDSCANIILSSAWHTSKSNQDKIASPPIIYNNVPSEGNVFKIKEMKELVESKRYELPLNQAIWYPFVQIIQTYWVYKLAIIFYHTLPGYIFDLILKLRGEKPRLVKLYKKIHLNIDVLHPFMNNSWHFDTCNTEKLWECLSIADQKLFHFDIKNLNWNDYFERAMIGMRIYLGKEEPTEEAILKARKRANRFLVLHRLLQFTLCACLFLILRWFLHLFI